MLKRFWNVIRSWFGAAVDQMENPELLLNQAQEEMRALHAKNRERAVQAITQKNNLQQMVDDTQKRVDMLQSKAESALKRGDRELALQLLKEKQQYEVTLNTTKESLTAAIETAEAVKVAIKREEEKIRQKTAEALALKAQWKNSQIQIAMNKALESMTGIDDQDQVFGRASAKIKNATSEMKARSELSAGNLANRMNALEMAEGDVAAENELAALESKLGLSATTTPQTTVKAATSVDSDIERQLAELEQKVGGAGNSSGS